ncbi:hypothetical protein N0V90_012538 [Kalmusia sp. IMI 367209]|nr:hypothetical protein N0V90_012538 [Kalmusia sp. IMI 367209]
MEDRRSISSLSSTREAHPNRAADKGGSYSTLRQNEDGADKGHVATHIILTPSFKGPLFSFGWWWEVYATALAIASTAAVIAVLVSVHGKPLTSWKLPIQPASLVSVFSTIAKSALLVPITGGISQLKWSYFESPRTLNQMQIFDDASRGPMGALVMLWKTRTAPLLASFGAFITIMLLAFEPFTQQVVKVELRDAKMANETSTLSYASSFNDYRLDVNSDFKRVGRNGRLTFTLAMMAAWTGRPSTYQSNNVCGTKTCRYPNHVSLSAETKCDTKEIRTTSGFGCTYYVDGVRFTRLQDFKDAANKKDKAIWYPMNCTIEKEDFSYIIATYEYDHRLKTQTLTGKGEGDMPSISLTNSPRSSDKASFGNAQVVQQIHNHDFGLDMLDSQDVTGWPFAFCASKRYHFDSYTPLPTLDDYTLSTFTCVNTDPLLPGIANLDTFGEFNATLSHCSIHVASLEYTNRAYDRNPNNLYHSGIEVDFTSEATSTLWPLRFIENGTTGNGFEDVISSDGLDTTLFSDDVQYFLLQRKNTSGGWPAVIEDIGKVAGEYIRSSNTPDARNMTGTAWAPQPFIIVPWLFLFLPLSLVVLSMVFLMLTALQRRTKAYLYKSSVLAATLHGLEGWSAEDMRGDRGRETESDLEERAKRLEARLVDGEDGGILSGSVDVIGGCGGLGFHIVTQILQSGDAVDVTVLDIDIERNRVEEARYVKSNVSSHQDVSAVLTDVKPRIIFHVASPHLMHQSATPKLFEEVNVLGTHNLLDCIYKQGDIKVLIYTSSTGIIHNEYTDILNANEDVPIFPQHPEAYGPYAHRLAAKKLLKVDVAAPPSVEDNCIDGELFIISNDEQWRFWDFVRAVGTAAGCGVSKENFKIVQTWVYYAIAVIAKWSVWLFTFGRKESQINQKMIRFFTMTNTFDIGKAKNRLGYTPQRTTQEGIDKAVQSLLLSGSIKKTA